MTTLAYPSADFPGQPAVSLDVPQGWEPVHAPGATMAARLPREGSFAPNVVVTVEQCGPVYRVEDSLEQVAVLAATRGGSVSEPYAAELAGARFVGCDATWPDGDVDTVLQANLFHHVASGETSGHVVQLTGAVGGSDAEADYELIRQVLTTVRVVPWGSGGAGTTGDAEGSASSEGPASTEGPASSEVAGS